MAGELRAVVAKAAAGLSRTFAHDDTKGLDKLDYQLVFDLEGREEDVQLSAQHIRRKTRWWHGWPLYSLLALILGACLFLQVPQSAYDAIPWQEAFQDVPPSSGGRPAPRKAVVVGSKLADDITWASEMPLNWTVYATGNSSRATPASSALTYLDWLIDNYRSLPAYIVFVHGDYQSWHQPVPLPDLVRALDLDAVSRHGWLNLRCSRTPSCMPVETWTLTTGAPPGAEWLTFLVRGIFSHIYRPEDYWYPQHQVPEGLVDAYIPPVLAAPAGSQFVVSRLNVWSKTQVYWERVREPLLMTPEEMDAWWPGQRFTAEQVEIAYEHLWHYFFLMQPVVCHEEDYCQQALYKGRIRCNAADTLTELSTQQDIDDTACKFQA